VLEQLAAQLSDLRHGQAAVIGDDQRLGAAEPLGQLCDYSFLSAFCIGSPPQKRLRPARRRPTRK